MREVTLRPVRFTDDVRAARTFLGRLGLAPWVESAQGRWVDLVAGAGGMVALHDAGARAARLRVAGFTTATVYDEAYGRVLAVNYPDGRQVQLAERADDLHGYRESDTSSADPRRRVRAQVVTPDVDRYRAQRLRVAGHDAVEGDDDTVRVTDADGVRLLVRAGQVSPRG